MDRLLFRQIFKFCAHSGIGFTICFVEQFKSFRPIAVPRGYRLPAKCGSFYTFPSQPWYLVWFPTMSTLGHEEARPIAFSVIIPTETWPPRGLARPALARARRGEDGNDIIHERLVDPRLEHSAVVGADRARRLGHVNANDFFLGINPEISAGISRPHELACRTRHTRDPVALTHPDTNCLWTQHVELALLLGLR